MSGVRTCGAAQVVAAASTSASSLSGSSCASVDPPSSVRRVLTTLLSATGASTPTAARPPSSSWPIRARSSLSRPRPLWWNAPSAPPATAAPRPTGVASASTAPMPAPLPTLRLPTLSAFTSPLSFNTRTPMASCFATPDSFSPDTAVSAAASFSKTDRTSVLFVMSGSLLETCGRACAGVVGRKRHRSSAVNSVPAHQSDRASASSDAGEPDAPRALLLAVHFVVPGHPVVVRCDAACLSGDGGPGDGAVVVEGDGERAVGFGAVPGAVEWDQVADGGV